MASNLTARLPLSPPSVDFLSVGHSAQQFGAYSSIRACRSQYSASASVARGVVRSAAVAAVEANITFDFSLAAAAHQARERGAVTVALAALQPVTSDARDAIHKASKSVDAAFATGISRLKVQVSFADRDRFVAEADQAQEKLTAYRQVVDAALAKMQGKRTRHH